MSNITDHVDNLNELIMDLAKLARREHYYCEDTWYSCPKAEGGCADDSVEANKCNCGADAINFAVDIILEKMEKLSREIY